MGVPLETVTTCALTLFCAAILRAVTAFFVSAIMDKEPPAMMQFPMWEGMTFLVQYMGYQAAVIDGLRYSCNEWMIFCAVMLMLWPVVFSVFAFVWILIHHNDGKITWEHVAKPGVGQLWSRLKDSETCLTKYFTLCIWREERANKGAWSSEADHHSFWGFLVNDFSVYEV